MVCHRSCLQQASVPCLCSRTGHHKYCMGTPTLSPRNASRIVKDSTTSTPSGASCTRDETSQQWRTTLPNSSQSSCDKLSWPRVTFPGFIHCHHKAIQRHEKVICPTECGLRLLPPALLLWVCGETQSRLLQQVQREARCFGRLSTAKKLVPTTGWPCSLLRISYIITSDGCNNGTLPLSKIPLKLFKDDRKWSACLHTNLSFRILILCKVSPFHSIFSHWNAKLIICLICLKTTWFCSSSFNCLRNPLSKQ